METITDQIEKMSKGLLTSEPEYGEDRGYRMFNDGGVECETGEFLFGLVRLTKPRYIFETGTHLGVSAAYMAAALQANSPNGIHSENYGRITTVEFNEGNHKKSVRLFERLGLGMYTNSRLADVKDIEPDEQIDILFLDTEPNLRFAEFERFFDQVKPGGLILIHDLHPGMSQDGKNPDHPDEIGWPYGPIPAEMKKRVQYGEARPVHFRTPRGLTMFYKVAEGDYVWPNLMD